MLAAETKILGTRPWLKPEDPRVEVGWGCLDGEAALLLEVMHGDSRNGKTVGLKVIHLI